MIYVVVFLFVVIILVILGHYLMMTERQNQQNQAMKLYLSEMRSFSCAVEDEMTKLNLYRHDLARYIRILEKLATQTDDDQIRRYTDVLRNETRLIEGIQPAYCEHEGVNTVLSIIQKQCESSRIEFKHDLEEMSYRAFENVDLLGLLYNLLEDIVLYCQERQLDEKEKTALGCSMKRMDSGILLDLFVSIEDDIKKAGIRQLPHDETTVYMLKTVGEQYGLEYEAYEKGDTAGLRVRIPGV